MKPNKNYYLILCLLLLSVSTHASLQKRLPHNQKSEVKRGIQWTTGLSWEEIKQKAKQEKKYIFLDVYATWCGPCKEMDKYVYPNDTVGEFFNDRFISVKVQTDQNINDEQEIKNWYAEGQIISKTYRIMSLPSFIFLNPNGELAHKAIGFHGVQKFIREAEIALKPGQLYYDPHAEFDRLESNYKQGKKDYSKIFYMIKSAKELGRAEFEKILIEDYCIYLEKANPKDLYTKENMEFLNEVELKSNSRLFSIFYPDGKRADEVAGKNGFSERMVHRLVLREIVNPFLKFNDNGAKPIRPDGKALGPVDVSEADWKLLYRKILAKYPREYADKGVLNAKLIWYEQKENFPAYYAMYLQKLDKYGFDTISTSSNTAYPYVNLNCWFLFLRISDKVILKKGAHWMDKIIQKFPQDPAYIDTYANLLYKAGEKEKAISWEEKALAIAIEKKWQKDIDQYTDVVNKMRNGQSTW
ncbi:thioredoxin-related protein [Pedobacter sp. AK017]|uniref:thioredoxin family protein n=1 Tax=Pedobacter sp. AK017 TaxID=2723073 RepID=UPI00161EA1DB|nr:thioredoxin family protein [Pedobacter sp. AK017]MBB5437282.1 thioredoxin-related protein [Pedobacter sp. AK017]